MTDPLARSGELEAISSEYGRAIELIHRVHDAGSDSSDQRIRHWSLPASEISADFFCCVEHPRNGWFGFLADAAGHGLASAIFALHTPMLFRESVLLGMSLPAIYDRIDRFLVRQRISGYFVCGTLLRVQGREIEVVNAGMPDALLLGARGELRKAFPSSQLPFGIEKSLGATSQDYRLARDENASLLIYSDGLSDLGGPAGEALGGDGVLAAAAGAAGDVFERLVARVGAAGHTAHDDVSIAVIPVPLAPLPGRVDGPITGDAAGAGPDVANVEAALRIVEHFDRAVVLTDADQRILYVNPAFTEFTGYALAEAVGQTPRLLNSGRQGPEFYREMWQALLGKGAWSGEIWNRRKDGSLFLEWMDIRALRDEAGTITHYLSTFTVLAQHQRQQASLNHLALHDALTGLANRTLLVDRGEQAIHRADRAECSLAVLFIDLDRFKSINDSLGHDVGDQVLLEVSRRLAGVLREADTLARFGGDEFICLLSDVAKREDSALVATKLLAALEHPIEVAGHRFKIGASIGISAYPSDGMHLDDLIVKADRAMFRAKQAGGNLYRFFSSEMAVSIARQLEVEANLDAAIGNGQLEVHFQPKLDLASRLIVGAEVLVRWRDPELGMVPPGVFIPIAEKSDLIARIGNWVLNQACAALARWDGSLPVGFHLAVNVSPLQLERYDLAGEVANAIAVSGIAPGRLQLEVTESLFIRDTLNAAKTLDAVAGQGVSIALDDFGTGYSNLGSLSSLPLDTFKLDQCFVRDVHQNAANSSIARAVRHLADGLDKTLVAEGIESCEECQWMQGLGYRVGQGYKYGKPMAEAEFVRHLADWRPECCPCPGDRQQVAASGGAVAVAA